MKLTNEGKQELKKLKPLLDGRFKSFSKSLSLNDKLSLVATMSKLIRS